MSEKYYCISIYDNVELDMNFKICSNCGINKSLSGYYFRKRGPRAGKYYEKCKICMKLRGITYYHKNHKRQLRLAKIRNEAVLLRSMEYLVKIKNKPCKDCGKYFPPWAMDFDHRDPDLKVDNVATMRRFHNMKTVEDEINKCDLVCSNCHRNRTVQKKNIKYNDIIRKLELDGYKFNWK